MKFLWKLVGLYPVGLLWSVQPRNMDQKHKNGPRNLQLVRAVQDVHNENRNCWDLFSLRICLEIQNKTCVCLKVCSSSLTCLLSLNSFSDKPGLIYKLVSESRSTCGFIWFKLAVLPNQVALCGSGWVLTGYFESIRAPSSRWKAWRCQPCPAPPGRFWQGCGSRAGEPGRLLQGQGYQWRNPSFSRE